MMKCARQSVSLSRTLRKAWCVGLVSAATLTGLAVEAPVVREVHVRHLDRDRPSDDSYVHTLIATRPGRPLSQVQLSRDQRALLDSGRFAEAQVLVEPLTNRDVRVIYALRRRLRFVGPVTVSGNQVLGTKRIVETLGLKEDDLVDAAILAERCERVRGAYRDRFYPHAAIKARLETDSQAGTARVRLEIVEGERRKIKGFLFRGNRRIDDAQLREALSQPSRFNPFRPFFRAWRKRAEDFEHVRDTLRALYLDHGFLDVQIATPEKILDEHDRSWLKVVVDEGPVYRLASVALEGVTLFPTRELENTLATILKPGDVAGRGTILRGQQALRDYYGARGYLDTQVRIGRKAKASGEPAIDLNYQIHEGRLAYVRGVHIRGNTRTKDKVIRREIGLAPGAVFDEVQAERSRRRLENLGFFENVRFYETPVLEDPAQRDAFYEVTEKNTGQFMAGAGFSSIDNVIGFLEINQSNFDIANWPYFHGGGQKARASLEVSSSRKIVDVSWTEPWFLDRRLSLSLEGYRRELGYDEFDEIRIGGGASLTVPLRIGRLNLRYVFEQVRLEDVIPGDFTYAEDSGREYRFTDEEDKYLNAPLRLTWLYDTRNRAFVPTRGTQLSLFGEISGRMLGGDNETYTLGVRARQWVPLWAGHVLSLRLHAESVDSFGDLDRVPIGDRLFLGGGRTLRGFEYRDVGPKVLPGEEQTGRYHPVGGQTMAMASVEYNVPVFKVLRLAAFYDIGNVWSEPFDPDFSTLASSAGVGIRFDIPGFPVRLDYARPIEFDDQYTDEQRWIIWIGYE